MLEESHQWVSRLMYVGGRWASFSVRVSSGRVRGHPHRVLVPGVTVGQRRPRPARRCRAPWANQSWVWNWIQDAASRFSVVAGVNSLRRISVRLIVCGLGVISPGIASGNALSSDTFRPKRVPAIPMSGSSRAL